MSYEVGKSSRRSSYMVFGLVFVVAGAIRLYGLGTYSLWIDEVCSIYEGLSNIQWHPPLFLELTALWLPYASTDMMIRLLPGPFGMLALYFGWRLGLFIGGRDLALWVTLLLALSPSAVYFSRELRMYSLLIALTLLSWELFFRWIEQGGWRQFVMLVVVNTALLYTHYYSFFMIFFQGLAIVVVRPFRPAFRRMSGAMVMVGLCFLPHLPRMLYLFRQTMDADYWAEKVSWHTLWYTFRIFSSSYEPDAMTYISLTGLIITFTIWALVTLPNRRLRIVFVFGFAAPVTAAMITSYVLPTSVYVPRYLIFGLGPLLITAAAGMNSLPGRIWKVGVLSVLVILQGWAISYQYLNIFAGGQIREWRPRKEFRQATDYIADFFQPGDVVGTTCESGSLPAWYYLTYRRGLPDNHQLDLNHSYRNYQKKKYNLNQVLFPFTMPTEVREVVPKYRRLWLFVTQWGVEDTPHDFYHSHSRLIREWLNQRYPIIRHRSYYGIELFLFDLPAQTDSPPS